MKSRRLSACACALVLLVASVVEAKHGHSHLDVLHRRHAAHRNLFNTTTAPGEYEMPLTDPAAEENVLQKRDGQCQFPTDVGLVPVAPNKQNAGWAMSPDQPCLPGNYCPYACPPGQVSMQWDPAATSYSYPLSMNGGLYCDDNGNVQKPFPDKPYCQDALAGIGALNKASAAVSFCQTVLPGNEAMLIPNHVEDWTQLAVPDTNYWCETAAHYYINPPGTSCDQACVWGTNEKPVGNWSPYVAGGNTDASGNTFIKLGWNPVYLEEATPFRDVMPNWGVSIECSGQGCNGLPCAIDPSKNSVNEMIGSNTDGAGGGAFCVVTVPPGVSANFVVWELDEDNSSTISSSVAEPSSSMEPAISTSISTPSSSSSSSSTASSSLAPPSTPPSATPSSAPSSSSSSWWSSSTPSSSSSWWSSWSPSSWSSSSISSTSPSFSLSSLSSSSAPLPPLPSSSSATSSSATSSHPSSPALSIWIPHTTASLNYKSGARPAYSPHILVENVTHIVPISTAPLTSSVSSMTSSAPIQSVAAGAAPGTQLSITTLVMGTLAVSIAILFSA